MPFCIGNVIVLADIVNGNFYYDQVAIITFFIMASCVFIYCWSFQIIKNVFMEKGKKYNGKIIKAEAVQGRGTYYLFIEFYVNNKRMVRRTGGYIGNPNVYLSDNKCSIYEYKGKYMEADFTVRGEKNYNDVHTKITSHRMFMPKGDKYV